MNYYAKPEIIVEVYKTPSSGSERVYYKTTEYSTAGTYTYTSNGIGEFSIEMNGAGGGGSHARCYWNMPFYMEASESSNGGAGGRIAGTVTNLPAGSYSIVVGAGGNGALSDKYDSSASATGSAGANTSFGDNIANGGGGGYAYANVTGGSRATTGTAGTTTVTLTGLTGTTGGGAVGGSGNAKGGDGYFKLVQKSTTEIPDYDYYVESGLYYATKQGV